MWAHEFDTFFKRIAYIDRGPQKIFARTLYTQEQPWPLLYSQFLSSLSLSGPGEALFLPGAKTKSVLVSTPYLHPGLCLPRLIAVLSPMLLSSLGVFYRMHR